MSEPPALPRSASGLDLLAVTRRLSLFAALLVIAAIAMACGEETSSPSTPTATLVSPAPTDTPEQQARLPFFEAAECRFDVPEGRNVDCGFLNVPEDRSQRESAAIRLHVAVFHSESENPAPDPIVYLAGGPGEKSLKAAGLVFDQTFAPFLADRDFIMFDQRGVGFSEPALDCPELIELAHETIDQYLTADEAISLGTEAISACRDRLVSEGVNLAAYSSAESAADLNDLRLALGYEEWNLYGVSYGTRLALTTMRDFPKGIRSAVLDSTLPLQVDLYEELPANVARAFNVLFDGCAADAACDGAYPELETEFFNLVERLNRAPATVSVTNPLTGERFERAVISGDVLVGLLFQSLYASEVIPLLPQIIFEAREADFGTVTRILGALLADAEFASAGVQFSVQCGEEARFTSEEAIAAAAAAHPEVRSLFDRSPVVGKAIVGICETWGAREADPIENEPVSSEIPTLILSGEYDPTTPPAWGELVAHDLNNSFFFEFPGLSHGVSISDRCPLNIALAFLDDPAAEPDTSCLADMAGPVFALPTLR